MAEIQDVLNKLDDVLGKIEDNKEKLVEIETIVNSDKMQYEICNHCGGDGVKLVEGGTVPCPDCTGTGWFRKIGKISKD